MKSCNMRHWLEIVLIKNRLCRYPFLKMAEGTPAVYKSYLEQRCWPVAIAYKLTGERKYAEKLALLLCRLSAPGAFPTTLHANSQGIPQEGGFWEGVARSYD